MTAITQYMVNCGSTEGPFFQWSSTYQMLNHKALKATCLPEQNFAGHSFHLGNMHVSYRHHICKRKVVLQTGGLGVGKVAFKQEP